MPQLPSSQEGRPFGSTGGEFVAGAAVPSTAAMSARPKLETRTRRTRFRKLSACAAVLAATAFTSSCAVVSTSTLSEDGSLIVAVDSDYNSLNPAKMSSAGAYSFAMALFSPLVRAGEEDFDPGIAEDWTVTPTSAEFTLRPDVSCSDGSEVTAQDVKRSLDYLADPDTASPNRARTFGAGDVTVDADDEAGTVSLELTEPYSDLLQGLSSPWAGIVCGEGPEAYEQSSSAAPDGTGAWSLNTEASTRGEYYVFEKRQDFTPARDDEGGGLAKRLVFRIITSTSAVANEITAGGIDIGPVSVLDVAALEQREQLQKLPLPTYGSVFLYFRQKGDSPFAEQPIRQAVAQSLDRTAAAEAATAGHGSIGPSYVSSAVDCTSGLENSVPAFDPGSAAKTLQASGYERDGSGMWVKDGQRLSMRLLANAVNYPSGNEFVLEQLRSFGIDARLSEHPTSEVLEKMGVGEEWEAALFPYGPPMSSPNSANAFLNSAGASNWAGISNSDYDEKSAGALTYAADDPQRCELWEEAQSALNEEVDIVPMWQTDSYWFASEDVDVSRTSSPSGFSLDPTTIRVK